MNLQLPSRRLLMLVSTCLLVCFSHSCKYQIAVSPPWKKEKPAQKQEVRFEKTDLLFQIESAKANGRPVFLDFYTDWCGPCRVMDRDVFTDGNLAAFFNENFLNLKVNAEKGEGLTLAKQYGIGSYPTLLFLNVKGVEAMRVLGITPASKLVKIGKKISGKVAHQTNVPTVFPYKEATIYLPPALMLNDFRFGTATQKGAEKGGFFV